MPVRDRAETILRRCEDDLRGVLAEASAGGDYETVMWLAAAAQQIARISGSENQPVGDAEPKSTAKPKARNTRKSGGDYPYYTRLNGTVIKTGWSKRSKTEYRHKAPHIALRAVAEAALLAGAGGRVFAGGEVVSDLVDAEGQAVPDYQAYLCLGLLKQQGLLDQHGRTGYSIPKPEGLLSAVQETWDELPLETSR